MKIFKIFFSNFQKNKVITGLNINMESAVPMECAAVKHGFHQNIEAKHHRTGSVLRAVISWVLCAAVGSIYVPHICA